MEITTTSVIIIVLLMTILYKLLTKAKPEPPKVEPPVDFTKGMDHMWYLVQIVSYKMYQEDSLLDFDSLMKEMSTEIDAVCQDKDELQKWHNQYQTYKKGPDLP